MDDAFLDGLDLVKNLYSRVTTMGRRFVLRSSVSHHGDQWRLECLLANGPGAWPVSFVSCSIRPEKLFWRVDHPFDAVNNHVDPLLNKFFLS